jgi:hypothetical protein
MKKPQFYLMLFLLARLSANWRINDPIELWVSLNYQKSDG